MTARDIIRRSPEDTAGNYKSLAFGSDGKPSIAYSLKGSLWFARWDGSAWQREQVESGPGFGMEASLAYNPVTGQPGITHNHIANDEVRLVERGLAGWGLAKTLPGYGYASLAYDSSGAAPSTGTRKAKLAAVRSRSESL